MNAHQVVAVVLDLWPKLSELAGNEWPALKDKLLHLLQQFAVATDENDQAAVVIQLLNLLRGVQGVGPLLRHALSDPSTSRQVDPTEDQLPTVGIYQALRQVQEQVQVLIMREKQLAADVESPIKIDQRIDAAEGSSIKGIDIRSIEEGHIILRMSQDLRIGKFTGVEWGTLANRSISRYLNAGFFRSGSTSPLPTDQPLALDGGSYRLGVNVGQFWGPGAPGNPVPDDLLQPFFAQQPVLDLDVQVTSPTIEIAQPRGKLLLTQQGDSPLLFFDLVLLQTGRHVLDVDLIFTGNLLQSRRVEVEVVARQADPVPESIWPVQDSAISFTRTDKLDQPSIAALAARPRQLLIVAQRDLNFNRIGLRFYDTTSNADLGFQQTDLNDLNLTNVLSGTRKQLKTMMDSYAGGVGGSADKLQEHLGNLASAGRRLYWVLLPGLADRRRRADTGQRLQVNLTPGTTIQVAPLSAQLSVPWEVLYERKIGTYRKGHTRLCSTFLEHGPADVDCPHADDPDVVCPHGFWGYRYIIEQLPRWVEPHQPLPRGELPLVIRNRLPTRLNVNICTALDHAVAHVKALEALAPAVRMTLMQADSLDSVRTRLTTIEQLADIVYFYVHAGLDDFGGPYLMVGQADQIGLIDLRDWDFTFSQQPLVLLNACDSANYAPDSFENLIKFFCDSGAVGVIGTQCEVRELLASAFALQFFTAFLRQKPAGQALFEARQALLRQGDPRGLVYSLFAAADVVLQQPVIV